MDSRHMLGGLGLLVGASAAMMWELKTMPAVMPEPAAVTSDGETDESLAAAGEYAAEPTAEDQTAPDPTILAETADGPAADAEPPDEEARSSTQPAEPESPPRAAVPPPATIDPARIRIKRVLVGGELVAAGIVPEAVLVEQEAHSKYIICFEIATTRDEHPAAALPRCEDFRLEDDQGVIAAPLAEVSSRRAAAPEHTRVFFAIYNDSAPARLLYRTADGAFRPLPGLTRP